MRDLVEALSDKEVEFLDEFLLNRADEDMETDDDGIIDMSSLDGFFTAIVSGPSVIPPSVWLPSVWGDCEPVWNSEKEFTRVFSLMMRHMNHIAGHLMQDPETFEPMFQQRVVDGDTYLIVDEWCEGFMRGVMLDEDAWEAGGMNMTILLAPIRGFTQAGNWSAHDYDEEGVRKLQNAITLNVPEIHAFWLALRGESRPITRKPVLRDTPRVGRNDPCPCGSGKKYKKCCLQ